LTSIIEKRLSLHKNLAEQREQNISLQSQLIQFQSLANIGAASCMIAHEINNLLTPLVSYAAMALEDSDDIALVEKALNKTIRGCEQATKVMESMLALANGQNQEKENARLATLVEGVFDCLCRDFKKDGITVKIQIPEDLTIWAVPIQIQHVLMNLILNARDAMLPRGGILTISAKENNDAVHIEVTDTGCGIEQANLKKIFEPFFTTKTNKKSPSESTGSGLGLAFCKKIIEAHDGCISVESAPAQGTAFTISLPKPPLGGS
jgi:two-component system NtrC family sensor kinase